MLEFIRHNWALMSIAATLAVVVVVPCLVLRKYLRIAFNIFKDTEPPLMMMPIDFVRIEGEVVEFRAFDGLRLRGMWLYGRHEAGPRGTIIFAHEYKSDMYTAARYCQGVLDAGYDVFSFDFRCHGASSWEDGYNSLQWCTDREISDILGAIAFVEDWLNRRGRPLRLGLFGISRGAAACLVAAWHHPRIKAIVADGAFSTDKIIEYSMKRWANIFARFRFTASTNSPSWWRFLRWLLFRECRRKLGIRLPSARKALLGMRPTPILFIHGAKDGYIPVDQTRLLYAAARDPKFLWIVPNAKHNQNASVQPEQYARKTSEFFDSYLAERSPAQTGGPGAGVAAQVPGEPEDRSLAAASTASAAAGRSGVEWGRGGPDELRAPEEPDPAQPSTPRALTGSA